MGKSLPLAPEPMGDAWTLNGNTRPPTTTVMSTTVLHALLTCLTRNPQGVSLARCQAAVDSVRKSRQLKGDHPVMELMRWAAPNRGITFTCADGIVRCELPDALRSVYDQ